VNKICFQTRCDLQVNIVFTQRRLYLISSSISEGQKCYFSPVVQKAKGKKHE